MPLHIEILYNEYNFSAAFAVSSLLALLALVTPGAENAGGMAGRTMSIQAHNLRKQFGAAFTALDGVDLNVPRGKLVALLGAVRLRQKPTLAADHRRLSNCPIRAAAGSSFTMRM